MHMFERHLTKHLREGETALVMVRRSPLVDVPRWGLAVLCFLGAFFFLVPLIRAGAWGVAGFSLLVGVGLLVALRTWFVWSLTAFLLTAERLVDVDQRGFFTTEVSSASYDRIQDVSYAVRGLWQTAFQIGTVEVQTAGTELRLELTGVRDPKSVQERLTSLISERRRTADHATADRLLAALDRVETARPAPPG